jgi:hypothetical protein
MSRRSVGLPGCIRGKAIVLALMLGAISNTAMAGRKTRLFNFENGTVGATAATALNTIAGPVLDVPDGAVGPPGSASNFYGVGPNGIPEGTPLGTWVSTSYDSSPDFSALGDQPTYVNVANGSPLDSPAAGSNVGLQFSNAGAFGSVMTGQGFRGTFLLDAAIAANEGAVTDGNMFTSFTMLSQAWVRPDPASMGTQQAVWSVGAEQGSPVITTDGFWRLTATGPIGDIATARPVTFGQWTHVAVLRTGGAASIYINGAVAGTANGFFNTWPSEILLGASSALADPFNGVIDNFSMVGTAGFGITISTDLDYFSDLGLPTPSGVAGDVDQDGDADQADYVIWSNNAGFTNNFGQGDLTTLIRGDLDQNGKIDFFDFRIIARQAAAAGVALTLLVPEPAGGLLLLFGVAFARQLLCQRGGAR